MSVRCKDGETTPCIKIVHRIRGVNMEEKLTNGWTFDGRHFEKRGEKKHKNYYPYMSEPEDPPPTDEQERHTSSNDRRKKKSSRNKRPVLAVKLEPESEPESEPEPEPEPESEPKPESVSATSQSASPAPDPAPYPYPAAAPAPAPAPAAAPAPGPDHAIECSEYEEKIFYRHTVDSRSESNLFSRMNITDDKLTGESLNKSIKLERDWFMDYVHDLIPQEGIFVVLDESGFFVHSNENGNIRTRSMFARDFKTGKFNFKNTSIDFTDFIISFLKKHIIVFSHDSIIHLNFQQYSYGDRYIMTRIGTRSFYHETVIPFFNVGYIYEMYTLMNEETILIPQEDAYDNLLQKLKLLEKWYPNLEIIADIANKKYILKTQNDVIKKKIKSASAFRALNMFAPISELEFTNNTINLGENANTHLEKLEQLKKLARCRLKYYDSFKYYIFKEKKLPIELAFGIDINTHKLFVPFSELYPSYYNVYLLEDPRVMYENPAAVPKRIRGLSKATTSLKPIEKLVEDYLKDHSPVKRGGKLPNRRLKSRRMLKKSGYKKTRKYNRKLIK